MILWIGLKCVFSCETDTDGVVISPGGRGVDYKPENEVNVVNPTFDSWLSDRLFFNQESKSFSFDGVTTVDHVQVGSSGPTFAAANQHESDTCDSNLQGLYSELLRPLAESVSGGFKGALLLCGASNIHHLTDTCVVKQVTPHSHALFPLFLKVII